MAAPILRLTRETLADGIRELRSRDPRLGRWMDRVGKIELRRQRHQFGALCRSIIAQQLSSTAAKTIIGRFLKLFEPASKPDPTTLLAINDHKLRACGLSRQKLDYLKGIAREFRDGDLSRVRLGTLSDDEAVERLTRLHGVGTWTAEMFLIFSLGRRDVFSIGDLGLRSGVQRVEGRALTNAQILRVAERWAPYRSVASLYLWKIAHWKDTK